MKRSPSVFAALFTLSLTLSVTDAMAAPRVPRWADTAIPGSRPSLAPGPATSNLRPALRCVDDMLERSAYLERTGIRIVPQMLDDPGGKVSIPSQDMVIESATLLSHRSRFYTPIVPDPDGSIPDRARHGYRTIWVMGSVTKEQVSGRGGGGGGQSGGSGGGIHNNINVTNVQVRLYLVDDANGVLPGTLQNLAVTIVQTDKGINFTGALGGLFGLYLSRDKSEAQTDQQAAAILVDLAMLQATGELAQIPYEQCLAAQPLPGETEIARRRFEGMSEPERIAAIAGLLRSRGLSNTPPTDILDDQLRLAIARYAAGVGLPALGVPSFDIYESLSQRPVAALMTDRIARGPAVSVAAVGPEFRNEPGIGGLTVSAKHKVRFDVTVAEPAYVTCLYTDDKNRTTLVYPNPQRPGRRLEPGENLTIPGPGDLFSIRPAMPMDATATEAMTCLADTKPFSLEVTTLVGAPLAPTPVAVEGRADLVRRARALGLATSTQAYTVQGMVRKP